MEIANSPRISAKHPIRRGRGGHRPLRHSIQRALSEFHTSNIQRARTKQLARYIVRLGNPIGRPPEGRSDDGNKTITRTTKRKAFQARKRYFVLQRLFFAYFFLTSQKKVCRRRHPAPSGAEFFYFPNRSSIIAGTLTTDSSVVRNTPAEAVWLSAWHS